MEIYGDTLGLCLVKVLTGVDNAFCIGHCSLSILLVIVYAGMFVVSDHSFTVRVKPL